jgi:acyl-coenzyme A synthetase/AMP-(fatty) acid ligase
MGCEGVCLAGSLGRDDAQTAVSLGKAQKLDKSPVAVYTLLGDLNRGQTHSPNSARTLREELAVEIANAGAEEVSGQAANWRERRGIATGEGLHGG